MKYKVVVTTKDGQFAGLFCKYKEAERFVDDVFDCAYEEHITVIISTTEEE